MKKILITSVSAGAGHVRAAQAIEQYLKEHCTVEHHDLMTFSNSWFKAVYADYYLDIINHTPTLWKLLYKISDRPAPPLNVKTRTWIEYKNHQKFFNYLENFNPDVVVSTHFMPPEILVRHKRKTGAKYSIAVVVTDFDAHYLWVNSDVDLYLVGGEKAKERLIQYGIDINKIIITGIPVMPQFLKQQNKESLSSTWNFDSNTKKILLMAGGAGVGNLSVSAEKILKNLPNMDVIALAGKNKALLNQLKSLQSKYPHLYPMGFTTQVHELMALSDLIVTKPGGLSTSEALLSEKPMLLVDPIPGQEEHNADYLQNLGVAKLCEKELVKDIEDMLNNIDFYKANLALLQKRDTQSLMQKYLLSI